MKNRQLARIALLGTGCLLGILLPAQSHAQTFVQAQATPCIGSGASVGCAFPGNTHAGNTGFALVIAFETGTVPVSDTQGKINTTPVASCNNGTEFLSIFEADNLNSAAETITIGSGAFFIRAYVGEYSGLSTTAFDKTACGTGSATTITSGNTPTLSQANELVIGWIYGDTSQMYGAGFNHRANVNNQMYEDKNVTSTAAVAATGTQLADPWVALCATFKASGGGVVCAPTLSLLGVGRCG